MVAEGSDMILEHKEAILLQHELVSSMHCGCGGTTMVVELYT